MYHELYNSEMDIVTFTDARANLKAVMDKVAADKSPVIIHRRDAEDMVMVSKAEWEGLQETLHLLSSPRNAARLLEAIGQANRGDYAMLVEPDERVAAAIMKAAKSIAAE
jgi:antitoxin YefM